MKQYFCYENILNSNCIIEDVNSTHYSKATDLLSDILYMNQQNEYIGSIKSYDKIKDLYAFLLNPKITNQEKISLIELIFQLTQTYPYMFDLLILPSVNGNLLYYFVLLYFREITQENKDEKLLNQLLLIIEKYIIYSNPQIQIYQYIYEKLRVFYLNKLSLHKNNSELISSEDNFDIIKCLQLMELLYTKKTKDEEMMFLPKNYLIHNGNTSLSYKFNTSFKFQNSSHFHIFTWFCLRHSSSDIRNKKTTNNNNKTFDCSINLIEIIFDDDSYIYLTLDLLYQAIKLTYKFSDKNKLDETDKFLLIQPQKFYFLDLNLYSSSSLFSSKLNIKIDLYCSDNLLNNAQQISKMDMCKNTKREIKNISLYKCFQGITTSTLIFTEDIKNLSDLEIPENIIKYGVTTKNDLKSFLNTNISKGNKLQFNDIMFSIQTPFDYYLDRNYKMVLNEPINSNYMLVTTMNDKVKDNQDTKNEKNYIYGCIFPHKHMNIFKHISKIGGIIPFIPILEIIKTNNSVDQFEKYFRLITNVVVRSKYNYITALNENFFKALSVVLCTMPSMFFTEEIWKCFVIIQKFFCNNIEHLQEYFKNKVEKYNSFFDDILTNNILILKFDNSIKTKAWELIYSLLDTINPCLLQRNINLDNLSMYLLQLDSTKYKYICCKTHNELLKYPAHESQIIKPDITTQLKHIKVNVFFKLFKLEILKHKNNTNSNENKCNSLIRLLLLDISPCLKLYISKLCYSFVIYAGLKEEELEQLKDTIFDTNTLEIFIYTMKTSSIDLKESLLSLIIALDHQKLGIINLDVLSRICGTLIPKDDILNTVRQDNEINKMKFPRRNSFSYNDSLNDEDQISKTTRNKSFDKTFNNNYNVSHKIINKNFPSLVVHKRIPFKKKRKIYFQLPLIKKEKYISHFEKIFNKIFIWFQFQISSGNIDNNDSKGEKILHYLTLFANKIRLLSIYKNLFFNLTLLLSEKFKEKTEMEKRNKKEVITTSLHSTTILNFLLESTFHLFLISHNNCTQYFSHKKEYIDNLPKAKYISTVKEVSFYGMKITKLLLMDIIKCGSYETTKLTYIITWASYQANILESWNYEKEDNATLINILKDFLHELLDYVFLEFPLYNNLEILSAQTIRSLVIYGNIYYYSLLFLDQGYHISKNPSFFISLTNSTQTIDIPDFIKQFQQKSKIRNFIHCFDLIWKSTSISGALGDNILTKRSIKDKKKGIDKLIDNVVFSTKISNKLNHFLSILIDINSDEQNQNNEYNTDQSQTTSFQYVTLCKLISFFFIMNISLSSNKKELDDILSFFEDYLAFLIISTTNKTYVEMLNLNKGEVEDTNPQHEIYIQIILFGFGFLLQEYKNAVKNKKNEKESYEQILIPLFYLVHSILSHKNAKLINSSPIAKIFYDILSDNNIHFFEKFDKKTLSNIENYVECFSLKTYNYWDEVLFQSEEVNNILQYYFDKNKVLVNCIVLYSDLINIVPLFMNLPSESMLKEKNKISELKLKYKPQIELHIEINKFHEKYNYFGDSLNGFYSTSVVINDYIFKEFGNLFKTIEEMNSQSMKTYLMYLKAYQKVKIANFTWNGFWSDKDVFYSEKKIKIFKEKRVHHYTKEFAMPLLTPVFSMEKLAKDEVKVRLFGYENEKYPITFDYTGIEKELSVHKIKFKIQCFNNNYKVKHLPIFQNHHLSIINHNIKLINNFYKSSKQPKKEYYEDTQVLHHGILLVEEDTNKQNQNINNENENNENNGNNNNTKIYCSILKHGKYYFCNVEFKGNKIIFYPEYPNNDPNNLYYLNKFNFLQKKIFVPSKNNLFVSNIKISVQKITSIIKHNHLFFFKGFELFLDKNKSYYLIFPSKSIKQEFFSKLLSLLPTSLNPIKLSTNSEKIIGYYSDNENQNYAIRDIETLLDKWKSNKISAFCFLMHLNLLSGRSYHCIEEYPIFPWSIVNFKLDKLTKKTSFRNMNMPLGMIGYNTITDQFKKTLLRDYYRAQRQQQIFNYESQLSVATLDDKKEQLDTDTSEEGEEEDENSVPQREVNQNNGTVIYDIYTNEKSWPNEAYLKIKCTTDLYNFPKYYSSKQDVLHYLGRLLPFTLHFIGNSNSQNKSQSIMTSLFGTFRNSTKSKNEIKEITPEFFFMFEFMENENKLKLISNETASQIANVELPLWARNKSYIVVLKNKKALENKTNEIEKWVNIIFGSSQLGMIGNLFPKIMQGGQIMSLIKKEHKILIPYCISLFSKGILPRQLFTKVVPAREKIKIKELTTTRHISFTELQFKLFLNQEHKFLFKNFYIHQSSNEAFILLSNFELFSFKIQVEKLSINVVNEKKVSLLPKEIYKSIPIKNIPYSVEHNSIIIRNPEQDLLIIIQGGFINNLIYVCKNYESIHYIENHFDNSPITHIVIPENHKYSICATLHGSLLLFLMDNYIKWTIKKVIKHNYTSFISVSLNDELQMLITSDLMGYINLYTLPKLNRIRSLRLPENTLATHLFLSNYPLPCFVAYSKESNKFFSYSLNAREIEINEKNENKKFNQSIQSNQSGSGQSGQLSSESSILSSLDENIRMTCGTICKSGNFVDYLICGMSDGSIIIRKFPSMKLFNRIKVLKQGPVKSIQLLTDKTSFAVFGEDTDKFSVCYNKASLKLNLQNLINTFGFLGE